MTNIISLKQFEQGSIGEFVESKDNPEDWYVLIGSMVGEYSVHSDHETPEVDGEIPDEVKDANENAEGYVQIGQQGWLSEVFNDDADFVSEYGFNGGKLDTRLMNILVVHRDMLSEEALDVALSAEEV